ncbi:hypothetical protein NE237_000894 [Protea cynaroides]|uniref:Uncharacterized protein n=1 Tax=Protea cynaroides TaxID=273540 RepID=A0A9Q0KS53_9MAGN|nr:hypothetical protein NE237_000894 [Protea cynaroides]
MPKFSLRSFYLLFCILSLYIFPIRSQPDLSSPLRLPSETTVDLCAGTPQPSTCPVNCFRTDPVCGVDGITYWCGCADAMCAGTRVAKSGFCAVGNGGDARA